MHHHFLANMLISCAVLNQHVSILTHVNILMAASLKNIHSYPSRSALIKTTQCTHGMFMLSGWKHPLNGVQIDINALVREWGKASRNVDSENIRQYYQLTVCQYQAGHDVSLKFNTATTGRRVLCYHCAVCILKCALAVLIHLTVCLLSFCPSTSSSYILTVYVGLPHVFLSLLSLGLLHKKLTMCFITVYCMLYYSSLINTFSICVQLSIKLIIKYEWKLPL